MSEGGVTMKIHREIAQAANCLRRSLGASEGASEREEGALPAEEGALARSVRVGARLLQGHSVRRREGE